MFSDPQPLTSPGVGYILYKCPPTIFGSDMAAINSDSCIFRFGNPSNSNPFVATGNAEGDIWFRNFGAMQGALNQGKPIQLWFAPTTLDDFDNVAWEFSGGSGCINVNVGASFSIVFLNEIAANLVNTNAGVGCFGQFRLRGGLPEFDATTNYSVEISLASDPSVKGFVHTQPKQLGHLGMLNFSVPQPGIYNVQVEDGKSCGSIFQVNMSACDAAENVKLTTSDLKVQPGDTICAPVRVQNFKDVLTFLFNLTWDGGVLEYAGFKNVNQNLVGFSPNDIVVQQNTLTFDHFLPTQPFNFLDGEILFSPCFLAVGDSNQCSGLDFQNVPAFTEFTNSTGLPIGFSFETGMICLENNVISTFQPKSNAAEISIFPNPLASDETEISIFSKDFDLENVSVFDAAGREIRAVNFSEKTKTGKVDVADLPGGFYFLKIKTRGGVVVRKVAIGF